MADDRFVGDSAMETEKEFYKKPRIEQDTADTVGNQIEAVATNSSVRVQELLDYALRFLSTASNETLGACVAGLGAITYFILGRVGLVLIGIVGGIVLHATWEEGAALSDEQARSAEEKARKRREDGLNVLQRVLDWRGERRIAQSKADECVNDVQAKLTARKQLDFSEFELSTKAALTSLTDAVIQDYVKWWYGPLLPEDLSFPSACRQTLTGFLLSISCHLSRKRPADVFLDFLTNSSSIVIVFLNELANALTASASSGAEAADLLHQYLEQSPSSSLANVLDLDQQKKKLKAVSEDILQAFLDSKAYSCDPVRVFLRQMLASICLEMTVQSCAKPEWINGWIVYLLEKGEPELMNAIDAGVGDATAANVKESATIAPDAQGKVASPTAGSPTSKYSSHKRTVSRAEEAMDEAMQEAKRISEMIAAEEAKKAQGNEDHVPSGTTTRGDPTPTSSQSDLGALANGSTSSLSNDTAHQPSDQQPAESEPVSSFTNFDQLLNSQPPTALQLGHTRTQSVVPSLTLHNANISIFDDAMPGDKGTLRSKPTFDYLLQVEPATSQHPGWMIARKYADFETLHEVLRRISKVSGVPEFADQHIAIPGWRNRSKEAVRIDLEHYLRDALSFSRLAESEGMKRFLERDQGLGRSSPSAKQGGFGFPNPAAFESMGKGMLDVLSAAPKGAAGGGKAILGGVTGVLGGVGSLGQKKQTSTGNNRSAESSSANLTRTESNKLRAGDVQSNRRSQDLLRTSLNGLDHASTLPLESRCESNDDQAKRIPNENPSSHPAGQPRAVNDLPSKSTPNFHPSQNGRASENGLHLPPPPSEIPDDWSVSPAAPRRSTSTDEQPLPPPPYLYLLVPKPQNRRSRTKNAV